MVRKNSLWASRMCRHWLEKVLKKEPVLSELSSCQYLIIEYEYVLRYAEIREETGARARLSNSLHLFFNVPFFRNHLVELPGITSSSLCSDVCWLGSFNITPAAIFGTETKPAYIDTWPTQNLGVIFSCNLGSDMM